MNSMSRAALASVEIALPSCATLGGSRQSGYAEVNGGRLYYETAGSGEPIIFVHGFTLDMRMWDDQFPCIRATLSRDPLRRARLREILGSDGSVFDPGRSQGCS